MEPLHKQRLGKNYTALLQDLDARDVLPQLFQDGVITERDRDEINGEVSREAKAEKVLNLLYRGGPSAFQSFLTVLQRKPRYQHLVDALENNPDDTMIANELRVREPAPLYVQFSQPAHMTGQDYADAMELVETPEDRCGPNSPLKAATETAPGSIKICLSILWKALRRVPRGDCSLWSYLSVMITNLQIILAILLLWRDIYHFFGMMVFAENCAPCFSNTITCLLSHIMLILPLGEFTFCESHVKNQFQLSEEENKLNENEESHGDRLNKINKERSRIKEITSQAIKLTLFCECITCAIIVVLIIFTEVDMVDFDDKFFLTIALLFIVDLTFNGCLFYTAYYPSGLRCLNNRFRLRKKISV